MKTKKIMFTLASIVMLITSFTNVHAQNRNGSETNALLGSWKVRLTPGSPQTPQFDEFMTFSDGGGIVESNNFEFFRLGLSAGPGHGTWAQAAKDRFSFTFVKFLFTPFGHPAGTLKVTGTINYSPANDTWSGPATVAICDNQANNCNTIDVTNGQAARIVAGQ